MSTPKAAGEMAKAGSAADHVIGGDREKAAEPFMERENKLLENRTIKYNWRGEDHYVRGFAREAGDEVIRLEHVDTGEAVTAPLTEEAKHYVLARLDK